MNINGVGILELIWTNIPKHSTLIGQRPLSGIGLYFEQRVLRTISGGHGIVIKQKPQFCEQFHLIRTSHLARLARLLSTLLDPKNVLGEDRTPDLRITSA